MLPDSSSFLNFDNRLWEYLRFLSREHTRCDGGPVSVFYVFKAWEKYRNFVVAGNPTDRFNSWAAVQIACSWLGQLPVGDPITFLTLLPINGTRGR